MKGHAVFLATAVLMLFCLGCAAQAIDSANRDSQWYRGELIVLIADDFKGQTAEIHYQFITATDKAILGLNFPHGRPDSPLPSGTLVEIRGRRHHGRLEVDELRVIDP